MVDQAEQAIQSALNARHVFCKFLSANDSGETGGHQAGILVSVKAMPMMFSMEEVESSHILERTVKVQWPQIGKELENRFKWYESKKELRITTFGRGFELKKPEHTGAHLDKGDAAAVIGVHVGMNLEHKACELFFFGVDHAFFGSNRPR